MKIISWGITRSQVNHNAVSVQSEKSRGKQNMDDGPFTGQIPSPHVEISLNISHLGEYSADPKRHAQQSQLKCASFGMTGQFLMWTLEAGH
jgi:hypothetical protein